MILGASTRSHSSSCGRISLRIASLVNSGPADHEWGVDCVLHELLLPERNRQQREMMEAIDRVCVIIQRSRNMGPKRCLTLHAADVYIELWKSLRSGMPNAACTHPRGAGYAD